MSDEANADIVQDGTDAVASTSSAVEAVEGFDEITDEEVREFVEHTMQFLMGIGTDPLTLTYLNQCSWEDAYDLLQRAIAEHSRVAAAALYEYVRLYYPEIGSQAECDAKVRDIENESGLWWQQASAASVADPTPVAILHVRHEETQQWIPLYHFAVSLKPTGPEIDGNSYEGYLPHAITKIRVPAPTRH